MGMPRIFAIRKPVVRIGIGERVPSEAGSSKALLARLSIYSSANPRSGKTVGWNPFESFATQRVRKSTSSYSFCSSKAFVSNALRLACQLPLGSLHFRRHAMITLLEFAILAIATMFAVAAAAALSWMFLRVAFALMQPATARRIPSPTALARGTAQLARAYAANR